MLLMLSGDIETNPGPDSEETDSLVSGLADLVGQAPAGMRNILCAWAPDKPSNEIVAVLNSKEFTVSALQLSWPLLVVTQQQLGKLTPLLSVSLHK